MDTISSKAYYWAVKELARRAGVTHDFFNSWTVDIARDTTTIHIQCGTAKEICFSRNLSVDCWDDLAGPNLHTVRARWMSPPGEPFRTAIPDLIVPFCDQPENGRPLFCRTSPGRIECFADLPASILFSLCRIEEMRRCRRDVHSRFTAEMSVARRDGFLDRPVVDEWGLAFAQGLEALVPGWRPKARPLRSKISHDVDDVGLSTRIWPINLNADVTPFTRTAWMILPYDLRRAIKLSVEHSDPIRGGAQLFRALRPSQPSCLGLVQTVVSAALLRGLDSAVYWKASRLGPFDSGYDPRDGRIQKLICMLREQGVENGVHPGYRTFRNPQELQAEVQILQKVLGEEQLGGRQHYLRWCTETWMDWENCRLAYDSTVGYADQVGFRAGTCIPFRPWLLSQDREARLLEIPLLVTDTSLLDYMRLQDDELLNIVSQLIRRCRTVGGVFTFLCHNTTLRDARFVEKYEQILDMLTSSEHFDWESCLSNEWVC